MGASSSKQEKARSLAVSRYHEFITKGLTNDDKVLLETVVTDAQGIIRMPGVDNTRIGGIDNTDFMMRSRNPFGPVGEVRKKIERIQDALLEAHEPTQYEWWREFHTTPIVETVDLADISDWFYLFVLQLHIRRIHLVVERQFDNVKLTRALMFLFFLCRRSLLKFVVSCNFALSPFVKPCLHEAHGKIRELQLSSFVNIVDESMAQHMEEDVVHPRWMMKETEKDGVVSYTFTSDAGGEWVF
jgi:hypothetical protein